MDNDEKPTKMHLGASPEIFRNAGKLRKQMTKAEQILWEALRSKKLDGIKFRQQHPVSKYVLDFYCHQAKLGIELDGKYHEDKAQQFYDKDRTDNLTEAGIEIIRFQNNEIFENLDEVLGRIKKVITKRNQ